MAKPRVIRYMGRERKENVLMLNDKLVEAKGSGTAKQWRKKRRR